MNTTTHATRQISRYLRHWPLAAIMVTSYVFAAGTTWNTGTGDWQTSANWDAGVPTATDDATIAPTGATATITISGSAEANSLSIGATTNHAVTLTGGTLALTSGDLAQTGGASSVTINSNIALGADGIWSNVNNTDAGSLSVNGIISGDHGITWQSGRLRLYGANTFTGGLNLTAGSLYLYNNEALGTGTLTISGTGVTTRIAASSIANNIHLSANATTTFTTGTQTDFNRDITLSGQITANTGTTNGNGQINFTSTSSATWRFKESITLRGVADGGLRLTNTTSGGGQVNSFIFSKNVSLSRQTTENEPNNGRIYLVASNGNSLNLLIDEAITFDGLAGITESATSGTGIITIGGIHASGTAVIAPSGGVVLNRTDTDNPAINLVSLKSGAVTEFSTEIKDNNATVTEQVRINASYQQVNAASTTGSTTVFDTHNPKGIVVFSKATGNTYKGGTDVYAGELRVTNTSDSATGTGAVNVRSGASLTGTGIIAPTGANGIVVQSGGILAPGSDENAIGTLRFNGGGTTGTLLTLETGATFDFKLGAGGASDQISLWNYITGDLSLSDNVINFTDIGGLTAGETYTLFTFFSDEGISVVASGINSGLLIGSGLEAFTGSYLVYNESSIQLVVGAAVPEPATCALLLGLATLIAIAFSRRQNN